MKGVRRFGKEGKFSPRDIGPYRISKMMDNVAYELELPQELAVVHPVFHISMLKKCMGDPSLIIPTENIEIKDSLSAPRRGANTDLTARKSVFSNQTLSFTPKILRSRDSRNAKARVYLSRLFFKLLQENGSFRGNLVPDILGLIEDKKDGQCSLLVGGTTRARNGSSGVSHLYVEEVYGRSFIDHTN
ncbi:hypothetical protein MTR67_013451 [Solanum verrucosum]|uniref:Tf2-1-like SH3-like domain-containing protein n=1 Tax=Solanum verrucosum TaxID=315347 RepID=A0AAF0QGC0_SOLVR|nr:hypothetical protein MTR67_013451 [Solanum verrucosum]